MAIQRVHREHVAWTIRLATRVVPDA
jgi:hypothetical protein